LLQSKRSRAAAAGAASLGLAAKKEAEKNTDQNATIVAPVKREQLLKKKLSYKEQRELDQLPDQIAALEAEQQALHAALADGSLYSTDPGRATAMTTRAAAIDDELMNALERWTTLSE
jgi:ATP-binding cassette subfamily F protein uup